MRSSRRIPRLLALLVAASLLLLQPVDARGQSLSDLKEQEQAAKRAADEAAAEVTEAIGEWNRIHHEIEETRARVAAKESRAEELTDMAVGRAVEAYKGASFEVADVLGSTDLLQASRKARLLGHVNGSDAQTIDRLEVEASDLEAERAKLDDLLEQQQGVLDSKREAEARMEARFEELREKRQDLEARLEAERRRRQRAERPSRSAPAPSAVNGLVCPFPGSSFVDSWGAPRSGGRRHKGVDMMGSHGAPLYAVTSGTVSQRSGGLGGLSVFLRGDDGNLYYYAHMSGFGASGRVDAGTVVGYNGSSGNASASAPHLHWEIKLGGTTSVNPYPTARSIC